MEEVVGTLRGRYPSCTTYRVYMEVTVSCSTVYVKYQALGTVIVLVLPPVEHSGSQKSAELSVQERRALCT